MATGFQIGKPCLRGTSYVRDDGDDRVDRMEQEDSRLTRMATTPVKQVSGGEQRYQRCADPFCDLQRLAGVVLRRLFTRIAIVHGGA